MNSPITASASNPATAFQWQPQPEAAALVDRLIDDFGLRSAAARTLGRRMDSETGTRLLDWVDHLALPESDATADDLERLGFVPSEHGQQRIWEHPGALFPPIITGAPAHRLAILVESVADFLLAQGSDERTRIEGPPLAGLRRAMFAAEGEYELWAVERHGSRSFARDENDAKATQAILHHAEALLLRQRDFAQSEQGFEHASRLVEAAIADLGVDRACDLFFAAERRYWEGRNHAARVQKARQDRLGLGWANHDHHTYRSSRECFASLVRVLEQLGLECRERFYAGREAGWGAQVLEQPVCRVVVFADVDLAPEEVAEDFAHQPLPPSRELGTVGLWCKLHGEAFLQAGMHHLECRFDFAAARTQLEQQGVESMAPFTDFAYLKQAFTKGETWAVDPRRIEAALAEGCINQEQADRFKIAGALGSHLEVLQRDQGYKGFNQTGISEIIRKTDPRKEG